MQGERVERNKHGQNVVMPGYVSVLSADGTPEEKENLVLLDDEGITPLNKTYFGKEQPTDVISFAYDEQPGHTGCTGEVMVNVDRAVQEGPARKGNTYELGLYIAHGCHHLMGASDETPALKDAMLAVETEWLEAADKARLLDNLFTEGTESTP